MTLAEPHQLLVHLDRQLARGAEHERLHRSVARIEALDDRNAKCCGLAAPGLRLADDVAPARAKGSDPVWIGVAMV